MTYREHRLRSDRAYFEGIVEVWGVRKASRLSGLHRATFYRKLKEFGIEWPPPKLANRGNSAWQSLDA